MIKNKIKTFLCYILRELTTPSWRKLRRYGNNRIIKSSYIWIVAVPIVAKLIPELERMLSSMDYAINLTLPFSWQLFYFGSLCFAISSWVYSAFCPYLIKGYRTPVDYWASGHGIRELDIYAKKTFSDFGDIESDRLIEKYKGIITYEDEEATNNSKFIFLQDETKNKRLFALRICNYGYCIGFLFFLWVMYQNLCFVIIS